MNTARSLGGLPLVVLSVTEQDRYAQVLTRLQAELVTLSSNSRHVTVAGATHYTLISEQRYAEFVAEAISAVMEAAQSGGPVRDIGGGIRIAGAVPRHVTTSPPTVTRTHRESRPTES